MNLNIPKSGELWQHFKGNKYWVIGIGNQIPAYKDIDKINNFVIYCENFIEIIKELNDFSSFVVKHSEKERYYEIKYIQEKWILYPYSSPILCKRVALGWIRPLNMFIETINNPSFKNIPRFTKVDI